MGNCLKRSSLLADSYLFEPLCPEEENIFDSDFELKSQGQNNHNKIIQLEKEQASLTKKLEVLEKNTQENIKLLSDDIHYINNKTTSSLESN